VFSNGLVQRARGRCGSSRQAELAAPPFGGDTLVDRLWRERDEIERQIVAIAEPTVAGIAAKLRMLAWHMDVELRSVQRGHDDRGEDPIQLGVEATDRRGLTSSPKLAGTYEIGMVCSAEARCR
jgi:hypothetical protein